jgi:murein DD-endopeptidase MepM/ murein hydrolase activator NlpD
MSLRMKLLAACCFLLFAGLVGWRTYYYFFDTSDPILHLHGIEPHDYYAGDIYATIAGQDSYKVSEISIWLDGNALLTKFRINSSSFEHPFTVPTKSLPNGKHLLKIEAVKGAYVRNKTSLERVFFVDNDPLQAAFVRPDVDYKVFQGRTLHIQFQVNKEIKQAQVHALSNTFDCFAESKNSKIFECFIPISCEEVPNEYVLTVDIEDKVGNTFTLERKFQVISFPFKKQLLHVSAEKVKTEKALGIEHETLERKLEELAQQSPKEKLWHGTFYPPMEISGMSTDFGTIRTTQEKGRYVHKAVDLVSAPRSVVWAPQDGIVVIKERYAMSGNTVVLDHGFGILSLFYHLDDFADDIALGKKVKRGNPLGREGKTGYASGYHLHWEMRINNIQIDPMQWISPNF